MERYKINIHTYGGKEGRKVSEEIDKNNNDSMTIVYIVVFVDLPCNICLFFFYKKKA